MFVSIKFSSKALIATATLALLIGLNQPAIASPGWFANTFIAPFNPQLANQLDSANAATGHPFEGAISGFADSVVPGAGVAMQAGFEAQRQGMFNNGGFQAVTPAVGLGSHCQNPFGVFGPGLVQQLGNSCMAPGGPGYIVP